MRNIHRLWRFPALPYILHKATSHLVKVCFRFVQITVFILLFSLLCFIINWFQTFVNAYKLYFILVHNVYIGHENVELVPLLSSVFSYLLHFLENRAEWTIRKVTCLLIKRTAQTKLVGFWDQSPIFQKASHASLNY